MWGKVINGNKNAPLWPGLVGGLLIIWLAGVCQGQVRVGQSAGRDASGLVGSRGRNVAVSQTPGVLGNRIVSGNIGGGQSFRGVGGVGDVTSFGGTSVGTNTLSGFRRDSYGLDYSASKLGVAQPFYLPSNTVLGVRGVTSGQTRPGSSMPASVNVNLTPFSKIGPARSESGQVPGYSSLGPVDRRLKPGPVGQSLKSAVSGPVIETASNLFGIRRTDSELDFDWSYEDVARDLAKRKSQQLAAESRRAKAFQALPEWAQPVAVQDDQVRPAGEEEVGGLSVGQERPMDEALERNVEQSRELIKESQGGLDVPSLAEVYEQIRAEQEAQKQQIAGAAKLPAELITPMQASLPQDKQEAAQRLARYMRIYNTFVSGKRSSFNEYIARGEELLRQGSYYQAARAYKLAIGLKADNPLGYLGQAYSLAGAGDLFSASQSLGTALLLFPEQAQTRIDLKGFFKSPEEIDRISTKLSMLAEMKEKDARIRLLLGYIYYYSGKPSEAVGVLQEAAELAKADPQMSGELAQAIVNFAEAVSGHGSGR